ncbi:WXG100 family type VII secretion target [Knoellia sp. CPCC 206453]|uniref:WXG100 family type VII secretion target n=1 Tax=Knoellia pratensis TaxID=3404796 RepID=UPI00361C3AEC
MSAQFQVDTERIQAASGDIARISSQIEGQVAQMLSKLTALQDAWKGGAATQFHGVVTQWQGTQRQVQTSLDSIGQVLAAAGAQYAETEAQNMRMFT